MSLPSIERYFRDSRLFRRVVQEWDFCTYREVREFDFGRDREARAPRPAARDYGASASHAKRLSAGARL